MMLLQVPYQTSTALELFLAHRTCEFRRITLQAADKVVFHAINCCAFEPTVLGGRERGREGGREGEREGEREGRREGGREREREGEREGWREGGREEGVKRGKSNA